MLTTFNEVDMTAVMALARAPQRGVQEALRRRSRHHLVLRQGCVGALKAFPRLNAEIQGDEIVLKHYYDIGIAVGADGRAGRAGPPRRRRMTFAEIEQAIRDFATQGATTAS